MNDTFEVAVSIDKDNRLHYDIVMYSTPKSTITMTDPTWTEKDDNGDNRE